MDDALPRGLADCISFVKTTSAAERHRQWARTLWLLLSMLWETDSVQHLWPEEEQTLIREIVGWLSCAGWCFHSLWRYSCQISGSKDMCELYQTYLLCIGLLGTLIKLTYVVHMVSSWCQVDVFRNKRSIVSVFSLAAIWRSESTRSIFDLLGPWRIVTWANSRTSIAGLVPLNLERHNVKCSQASQNHPKCSCPLACTSAVLCHDRGG